MAKSVTRSEFLNRVAERTDAHRRDVEHVWENALGVIQEAIKKGEAVSISGFGKFSQRVRKARAAGMARNPFTGEMVKVAARPKTAVPRFAPAKPFKDFVSGTVRSLPKPNTRPMALAAEAAAKATGRAAPKKAAAKKTAAKKTTAKKSAAKKPAARKGAKKTARKR